LVVQGDFSYRRLSSTTLNDKYASGRFNKISHFGKAKVMLDIRLNGFNLRLGVDYNFYLVSLSTKYSNNPYSSIVYGLGGGINVIYTFNKNG